MKTRTISAIVVLAIAIPIFLMGGYVYTAAIYVLSLLALREFIKIRAAHDFVGMDVSPFSFWAEQIEVSERNEIMVEIFCFEEMGIFHQIGIF